MSAHSVSRRHERHQPGSPSGGAPDRSLPPSRRGWEDAMLERLARRRGGGEATRLVERYGRVLPIGYAETTRPAVAAIHLDALSGVERSGGEVGMSLSGDPGTNAGVLRFTLVLRGRGVTLSAFVPILESVGLTVVEEITHRFGHPDGGPLLHVQDFVVQPRATMADAERDGRRVTAAVRAIWDGAAECDPLNQLVLHAALDWRDVAVLRAYRRYRRQVGTRFTEPYLDAALVGEPAAAAALVDLFAARLHPDDGGDERAVDGARRRVLDGCDAAAQLDTDRILRGYLNLVDATTRTNRWVVDADGRQRRFLALKLDSGAVAGMPRPAPHAEIFVCSPQMEGVHLRGGPMARGGVRWSERLEDYRTEILGLMRAQMVKNALIVPTGAKGGFVLKRRPADPEQVPDAVRDAYRTFVRGLLDVTDNVIDGRIVAPRRVRRGDDDDPYLVVAADRGTAPSRTLRTRSAPSTASGWVMRSPLGAAAATTTRRSASPREVPGWPRSTTSVSSTSTCRPRRSPSQGSAT